MSKRVLITGGTKGIGLASVKKFVDRGYDVAVIGRNFSEFPYENVRQFQFDLSNIKEIKNIADKIGDIDILVNNAGIDNKEAYDSYSDEKLEEILNVNLRAPLELINHYSKLFEKKGEGRIVNVASQAAEIGHKNIWYGITKAGLVNATKSYAAILGEKGVVINAVAPGPVITDMIENSIYWERYEKLKKRTYINRLAYAEEVAEVIFWLAAESPEYVNGETIDINNGVQRIK